jgi:hypothetical protein
MLNLILFYGSYLGGIFASLLLSPIFAFVLYEAVYFFNPQRRWWGYMVPDISYSFYVVLLMLGLMVLNWKKTSHNKPFSVPIFRWMYVVVGLYGLAYVYAVFPDAHAEYFGYFLNTVVIVTIAFKLCDSDKQLDYILQGYIFGSWYIGFVAFQTGRNAGGDRVEGIGTVDSPDANGIAAVIAPSLVLCLYYFWTHPKWLNKGLMVVAGAFIANGLVLINSRGAFLAVGASIGFFMLHMYFSSFQRKMQKATAVFITLFGLVGVASIVDQSTIQRFLSIADTEVRTDRETGATRTIFWKAAVTMTKDHPLGSGFKGFNYYAPFYIPEDVDTGGSRSRTVHSSWFEALTEIGYLGLFAFLMMMYATHRCLTQAKIKLRENNQVDQYFKVIAIQGACLAFVVAMTFINRMRAEILYWCLLYAAVAYNIYVLRPAKEALDAKSAMAVNPKTKTRIAL